MLATFQLKDQWKPILHIGDIVWSYFRKGSSFIGARMAEWSKAPDLRSSVDWATAIVEEFGCSGLLVEAWVRIPLLAYFDFFHIRKQQSSLVVMPTCSHLQVQAVDATLLSPTSGSSNCWRFPQKHSPLSQIQNNYAWDRVFLCNSKIPYEINVIWKKCYIWSACYIWNVIYESKIPVWTFLCSVLQRLAFSTVKCLFPLVR